MIFLFLLIIRSPSSWFAWLPPMLSTSQPPLWSAPQPMTAPSSSPTVLVETLLTPLLRDTHTPPSLPSFNASLPRSESHTTPLPLLISVTPMLATHMPPNTSLPLPSMPKLVILFWLHKQDIPRCQIETYYVE